MAAKKSRARKRKSPPAEWARFFRAIADQATVGIVAFEIGSGECLYCNALAREALETAGEGLRAAELEPTSWREPLRPFDASLWEHEGLVQDVLFRRASGATLIADVGVKRLSAPDGRDAAVMMFQDVTYQKKLQREVMIKQEVVRAAYQESLAQNAQLRELDIAKDRFFALMTHELRTPLSAVVATADAISQGLCESEAQKTEFIESIREQSVHLMELVNDILDFAKIRAGKMEFYIEDLELRPAVERVLDGFRRMAAAAGARIELEPIPPEARAWFDLTRFREVLGNVVHNAIKYGRAGGVVRVRVAVAPGRVRVSVSDQGAGIPPERAAAVFNEFETVGSVALHHKGTGLGMPISRRLIEAMGGSIGFESELGVGSTFHLELPTERALAPELYRARPDGWNDAA